MTEPKWTIEEIMYSSTEASYNKVVNLYHDKKVKDFVEDEYGYSATVIGTHPYDVTIRNNYFDEGSCSCYLGQRDILCKHMLAVAIFALYRGEKIPEEEGEFYPWPVCSNIVDELSDEEFKSVKVEIAKAMRYIKPYQGPSRIWFQYQEDLDQAYNRFSDIFSKLPVSHQTANLVVKTLIKIDKKLFDGVDDSNGTIGSIIQRSVEMLIEYAKLDPKVIKAFKQLVKYESTFDWEEDLVEIYNKKQAS